jgi:hypothetical protein
MEPIYKLTIIIKKAKPGDKSHKLFDGGGLYIQIEPTGGKRYGGTRTGFPAISCLN